MSIDADGTVARVINYHIRIRLTMEALVRYLGIPLFEHLLSPDAQNSDFTHPFEEQLASAFPVLVETGDRTNGNPGSLLILNGEDPPAPGPPPNHTLEGQQAPLDITGHIMLAIMIVNEVDLIAVE